MPVPPEIRAIFYKQMGEMLESSALRIWDANIVRQGMGANTSADLYDAISTEGNRCREFGVLDLETCIPGAELYYDAEYLSRNAEAKPNHMASDLFGHLQGDALFGAVVLRRKEHARSSARWL